MTLVGDNTLAELIWIYQGMFSKQRSTDAQLGVLGVRTMSSACIVCVGLPAGLPEEKPYGSTPVSLRAKPSTWCHDASVGE